MKLLIDANISFRIIKQLHFTGLDKILHVTRCGLPVPAKDTQIWKWAKENDFMIITNDKDFDKTFNAILISTQNNFNKNRKSTNKICV